VHPNLPSGMDYLPPDIVSSQGRIEITGSDNRKYREGIDFEIGTETIGGVTYDVIEWLIPASEIPANYTVSKVLAHDYTEDSVLNKLGFITADPFNNANWKFTEGSYANASDAVFEIDGVEVTRSSNTVDDLIANVTLELRGLGQVRINIVRDLEKTVEDIQKVVDEYNSVMDWINFYVSQKQDAANPVDETNYLSSILQRSRGNTVFGALHGDQLLWSIKNQLRTRLSNPINAVSTSLTSRKVVNPASAMNIKSSFYVYVGGKAAKITVEPTDSMEDISKKLTDARNIVSNNGSTATGGSLGLNVTIRDGQLVIDGSRASSSQYATGERDTISSTFTRRSGNSEYLSFVPITSPPVSGELMVFSGRNPYTEGASTLYREGIDYNVVTSTENDTVSSRIEWISGRGPQPNGVYNVSYSYFPTAVTFSEIPGSGPMSSEIAKGWNDLSFLELRQDASKTTVSAFGITTESINYGKSGLIEFDSEKFLSMMESDPDLSASAMLTFMRDFDAYIGNLVDSSQILVAGQPVTKGRIAGALNKIDNEQKTLNDRITKLEKELEAKQTALYKQYSDMEVAIQKLNAQMNSIANYLNSLNKGN
ncbi:MAG: flagellar filament capping protein FliD, partial [Synergistaceae bacterium]|nr:flagellar filament capping protein FliD [Synergistaceae bacterium]